MKDLNPIERRQVSIGVFFLLMLINAVVLCTCLYDTWERSQWERKNYQEIWLRLHKVEEAIKLNK